MARMANVMAILGAAAAMAFGYVVGTQFPAACSHDGSGSDGLTPRQGNDDRRGSTPFRVLANDEPVDSIMASREPIGAVEPPLDASLNPTTNDDELMRAGMQFLRSTSASEHMSDVSSYAADPAYNPDRRTLSDHEKLKLQQILDDHKELIVEVLGLRKALLDGVVAEKILDGETTPVGAGDLPTINFKRDGILVAGQRTVNGKLVMFTVARGESAEFEETFEIEKSVREELEADLKEFFATHGSAR